MCALVRGGKTLPNEPSLLSAVALAGALELTIVDRVVVHILSRLTAADALEPLAQRLLASRLAGPPPTHTPYQSLITRTQERSDGAAPQWHIQSSKHHPDH